jgi:hypothetical protein
MADASLGRAAYEAYCVASEGRTFRPWGELSSWRRAAWEAAATAAVEACGG